MFSNEFPYAIEGAPRFLGTSPHLPKNVRSLRFKFFLNFLFLFL